MATIRRANGHRPSGLLHLLDPALRLAPHPTQEDLPFDLASALSSVLRLTAKVPDDARSARTLGTDRQGNAVMIGDDGLALTIGYLVMDADSITLTAAGGVAARADLVGYNHESGLALVRALDPVDAPVLEIGDSTSLKEGESIIIAPCGDAQHAISGAIVSLREFAGSWEYLLDQAIFTTPIHPNWSGAALINGAGKLVGIGSLWVNDAESGRPDSPGNMFVPVDLLKPIFDDLMKTGLARNEPRAWLGMYTAEAMGRLFISGVSPDGPAEEAGIEPGDLVIGVGGQSVATLSEMYRAVWSQGGAGTDIVLDIRRDGESLTITVESGNRYDFVNRPRNHH